MRIAETERLVIRYLQPGDFDDLYELCGDPEAMRYVGDGLPLSREQTLRWIEKSEENYRKHGFGCMAVVAKEDGRLIGYAGLINPTVDGEAEIIYGFKRHCWGRGFASEAAEAMLDFGFQRCGLKRIVATIDPANRASVRIAERLGMKYQEQRLDEHNLPEAVYAIDLADY